MAEWLHHVLRQIFADQWPDDDAYDAEYDRAEAVLGVLAQDAVNVRAAANPEGRIFGRSHWYGRSTWRAAHSHGNPVADLVHEFQTQGAQWGPLKGGLFGGDEDRARTALEEYQKSFNDIVRPRLFWALAGTRSTRRCRSRPVGLTIVGSETHVGELAGGQQHRRPQRHCGPGHRRRHLVPTQGP